MLNRDLKLSIRATLFPWRFGGGSLPDRSRVAPPIGKPDRFPNSAMCTRLLDPEPSANQTLEAETKAAEEQ